MPGCDAPGDEKQLAKQLWAKGLTVEDRDKLIAQLDATPVAEYPLYERWFLAYHDELPFGSWDDDGFHPDRSTWPPELQIMWAADYSKTDIDNGGLNQYFGNQTGTYAPEFHEFLLRTGHRDAADVLAIAMKDFGEPFPRSQETRQRHLNQYLKNRNDIDRREDWDPFFKLDDQFYACFANGLGLSVAECERWMRNECGIQKLSR